MKFRVSSCMFKLLLSVLIVVAFAVIVMFWNWLSPVGFYQNITVVAASIILYIFMVEIGLIIILVFTD